MKFQKIIKSLFHGYKRSAILLFPAVIFLITAGSNKNPRSPGVSNNDTKNWPKSFGFGRAASSEEIAEIDIDVRPDGHGLSSGSGSAAKGRTIYNTKCASCHGKNGTEGPYSILVGAMGDTTKAKTIGNYWPYATTLFDYVRRAMPYNMPGSLSNNEVYDLTTFLLYKNKIIDSATIINAVSLPKVKMPAQTLFVNDDRRGGAEVR